MILYTPLSQTDIFPNEQTNGADRQCITHDGKLLYVEQMNDGSYELLQLLSTDPQDFLNASYTPGNVLS